MRDLPGKIRGERNLISNKKGWENAGSGLDDAHER